MIANLVPACDRCGHTTDTDKLAYDGLGMVCGACRVVRKPRRIQLRRTAGWRKPEGVVNVARPSRWGNPFAIYQGSCSVVGRPWTATVERSLKDGVFIYRAGDDVLYSSHSSVEAAIEHSVDLFRTFCKVRRRDNPREYAAWLAPLRGRDLGCWCEPDAGVCHGDVLLELAQEVTA